MKSIPLVGNLGYSYLRPINHSTPLICRKLGWPITLLHVYVVRQNVTKYPLGHPQDYCGGLHRVHPRKFLFHLKVNGVVSAFWCIEKVLSFLPLVHPIVSITYSLGPKMIVLPPGFCCPKTIVQFICMARNLRLKVKYICAKLSSLRSLSTPQLWGAFWSSWCILF